MICRGGQRILYRYIWKIKIIEKELDLDFEWNNLFNYCYWYKNDNGIYGQYNDYRKYNHKLVRWSDYMGGTYC